MLLNSCNFLVFIFYYMFPGNFISKFLVISKIFCCNDFFISDSHKTDYVIPSQNIFFHFFQYGLVTLNQVFLVTYSSLIFYMRRHRQWTPQSTFFNDVLIAYLYMIFVCANYTSFSPQPTIFKSARITYFLYA